MNRLTPLVVLGLACVALSCGTSAPTPPTRPANMELIEESRYLMKTMAHIEATGATREQLAAAFTLLKDFDSALHINAGPNHLRNALTVISDTFRVSTVGAFDARIGRLTKLWGFEGDSPRIPSAGSIAAALKNPVPVMDFGGIGKGFAAECAAMTLAQSGIRSAIINLGGNIQTIGPAHDGGPWRIAVTHPRRKEEAIGVIYLPPGHAVSTSGDYERFVMSPKGERLHHLLDPITGRPAARTDGSGRIISVSIQSPAAMAADAWSTGAFVLGWPEGYNRVEKEPNLEGLFVIESSSGEITLRATSGLQFDTSIAAR